MMQRKPPAKRLYRPGLGGVAVIDAALDEQNQQEQKDREQDVALSQATMRAGIPLVEKPKAKRGRPRKGEHRKTAAEIKRDYRAKEKALLESIKKSQQAQSDRYLKEAEERRLLEPIRNLTQEVENEEAYGTVPWRIGVYANFGPVSDSGGGYWAHGIVKPRTYKKRIPLWAANDSKIKELIQRSFPNWEINPRMRDDAARWAAVINLYFRNGYTRSQIAHEIGSTDCKISGIIRSIQRASKGLQSNGRGPRSIYGRGKHPNCRRKPKSNAAAKM